MTGNLPGWLQRMLGANSPVPGEGTVWNLESHWPWQLWTTLLIAAVAVAWVIYFYARESPAAGRLAKTCLAAMRLLVLGILALMIAQLMISMRRTGLPSVVVMIDNSPSMGIKDEYTSRKMQAAVQRRIKRLGSADATRLNLAKAVLLPSGGTLSELEKRYTVKLYFVSDSLQPAPAEAEAFRKDLKDAQVDGQSTRLGEALLTVLGQLRGTPPAAIVIFSDGVTSSGPTLSDAAQVASKKGIPLYVVALGSEDSPRDLELSDLVVDDVVFVDDMVNFQFTVRSSGLAGRNVEAVLRDKQTGTVLASTPVTLPGEGTPEQVVLPYRPGETGQFEYVVEIAPLGDEISNDNNSQSRTVSVRKETIRVLLVQAYPNYEYRYLKNLLTRDTTIELHSILQDADPEFAQIDQAALAVFPVRREELFEYDVIILGDVNPGLLSTSGLENVRDFVAEKAGGMIFIAGTQYTPMAYRDSPLAALMPFELATADAGAEGEAAAGFQIRPTELGLLTPQMQVGDTQEDSRRIWSQLPDVYWLFRAGRMKPAARVLAEHPTLTDADGVKLPVFCTQYFGSGQVLWHLTDETWRWRFRVGDAVFARYWIQAIRSLSRRKLLGKSGEMQLTTDRREYRSGEPVQIRARFFDVATAAAASGPPSVVIEQPRGAQRRVELVESATRRGLFEAVLSELPQGKYRVLLPASATAKPPSTDFVVTAPPGELARTAVDIPELSAAAEVTRGRLYRLPEVAQLVGDLPRGRQVPIETLPPQAIWNRWWMVGALFALLLSEWVIRKTRGLL